MCSVKFDDFEHVTCMRVASLRSADTVSGKKDYIIVSTCDVRTEEVSSKGKVSFVHYTPQPASISTCVLYCGPLLFTEGHVVFITEYCLEHICLC